MWRARPISSRRCCGSRAIDRIPAVSLPRTAAVPDAGDDAGPAPRRPCQAPAGRARLMEAVTFSFMRRDWAKLFGGGAAGAGLGQSHQRRSRPDAPVLAAQSPGGGGTQCGARLSAMSRCSRSGRAIEGDRAGGSAPDCRRRSAPGATRRGIGRRRRARSMLFDAKADALALLTRAGRAGRESADHDRCAGLVPSRPLRRAAAGGDGARAASASCIRAC